ncbi:3452_t:CDS:2 [Ambispora gerdemannii]|uniref:3452_t:CDS:1 n=1 Tax=Ambispora gerdemannii TaxID=144530 RepID=A0A9N8V2N9_9GLOM|nr:3452_t:CDS:2 [Ambispora gerdemannii]
MSTSRKRTRSPNTNEPKESKQLQCGHPKHEEYVSSIKEIGKRKTPLKRKLVKVPKRMYLAIGIKEDALICSRCIVQTDKDPEYLNHPKFVNQRIKTRQNVMSMLKIDMVDYPRGRKGYDDEEETLPPPAKKLKKSNISSKSSKTAKTTKTREDEKKSSTNNNNNEGDNKEEEIEEEKSQKKGKERKNGKASSSGSNLKTFKASRTNKNS